MGYRFNPPPNWPPPPTPEWVPPDGWRADRTWGPAPEGWAFWVEDGGAGGVRPRGAAQAPGPGGRSAGRETRTHPVLTIVLLSVAVLVSVSVALAPTDKATIL
jgi:hypothetical protein